MQLVWPYPRREARVSLRTVASEIGGFRPSVAKAVGDDRPVFGLESGESVRGGVGVDYEFGKI